MNQILISEKVYVTPELKRKKVFFKVEFILSVFLLCLLSSYYIYAEYDRNKSEKRSQEILESMEFQEPVEELERLVVILNEALSETQEVELVEEPEEENQMQATVSSNGVKYYTIGLIEIPAINVEYPILQAENAEDIEEVIKIAPCKFWGADMHQAGNLCIVGHNYRNTKFFSKVPKLKEGDIIKITDMYGTMVEYEVYDKYIVEPEDTSCTSQLTEGRTDITLITCTDDSKQRVIVKATAVT